MDMVWSDIVTSRSDTGSAAGGDSNCGRRVKHVLCVAGVVAAVCAVMELREGFAAGVEGESSRRGVEVECEIKFSRPDCVSDVDPLTFAETWWELVVPLRWTVSALTPNSNTELTLNCVEKLSRRRLGKDTYLWEVDTSANVDKGANEWQAAKNVSYQCSLTRDFHPVIGSDVPSRTKEDIDLAGEHQQDGKHVIKFRHGCGPSDDAQLAFYVQNCR